MAVDPTKPVIVLIPGMASVGTVVFKRLIDSLQSNNISSSNIIPINNPSCDNKANISLIKPTALEADIKNIRSIITPLIEEQGCDVLLVAHSYGGAPCLSAADGLWKHQRTASGQAGGVIRAALISAAMPLPSNSVFSERSEWQIANNQPMDGQNAEMEMVEDVSLPTMPVMLDPQRLASDAFHRKHSSFRRGLRIFG
jgi:pimeloyl-ACP methyl ester carboxylesterase